MPRDIASLAYYNAGERCYKLSKDFKRAADPLIKVLSVETYGMAGGYQAVKPWSEGYDERATAFVMAAVKFAQASQHLGDILIAAGYNWACAEWRANRDPNKGIGPACPHTIPSELPYGADTVVGVASSGSNGPGLESDLPQLYEKTIAKTEGHQVPDGDTDKLDKAAKAWKTFADNETVVGARSDLQIAADGLDRYNAPDIPHLTDHLRTLSTSAGDIRLAASDLATATSSHEIALAGLRSDIQAQVQPILVAGAVVVVAIVVRVRASAGAAVVEASVIDTAASIISELIGTFLATLRGIQFSAAALSSAGLAAILALTIQSITGETVVYSSRKPPENAYDPNGPKAPGYPGDYAGQLPRRFKSPKGGDQWVPNPKGRGYGWLDDEGNVWVPTGPRPGDAHGGPHWDVQLKDGGYENIRPPKPPSEPAPEGGAN